MNDLIYFMQYAGLMAAVILAVVLIDSLLDDRAVDHISRTLQFDLPPARSATSSAHRRSQSHLSDAPSGVAGDHFTQ